MFISEAYAQAAGTGGGMQNMSSSILLFVFIGAIFYFLIIRPQQQRMKQHKQMVDNIKRGDVVVTSGGLVGKVVKVNDDAEITVELAENVKVKAIKSMITEVRVKSEPATKKAS